MTLLKNHMVHFIIAKQHIMPQSTFSFFYADHVTNPKVPTERRCACSVVMWHCGGDDMLFCFPADFITIPQKCLWKKSATS